VVCVWFKSPLTGVPQRVKDPLNRVRSAVGGVLESGCLGTQPKEGGKLHLRLNMATNPIANKYREGKLKSTLKRELKRT
jgi:hypothetical protein